MNGYPVYQPQSKSTAQAYDPDLIDVEDMTSFYNTYPSRSEHSQLQQSQIMCESPFDEPLPSISPLSYPSQLQRYLATSERVEGASATQPILNTLGGSPTSSSKIHHAIKRFPGSSLSLHHPTPLGQQLQKQAERSSTQGSRNSIQGSRASISALGSKTSFSGSFFSSNAVSREEMQAFRTSEGEVTSLSLREDMPIMRKGSLDIVPTRDLPVQHQMMGRKAGKREFVSLTCIHNPHTTLQSDNEMREETKSEDENDLRKDPLLPIMTSTTAEVAQDAPIKGEKDTRRESTSLSPDSSIFTSPQRKAHVNLRELTSLSLDRRKEEGGESKQKETINDDTEEKEESGEGVESTDGHKEEAAIPQQRERGMSRLEKLTSLNYIRSSIRRSLKKNRISFLTRTPDSTPKSKKKSLPQYPELTPDPLTFSNQNAFDTEDPAQARIHTPSPLSPAFEDEDSHLQQYPEDALHPEVYPETHLFHHAPYGAPGHRGRTFSDAPHYVPQLSQPTYYPSVPMHYQQPPYPQLSQQYVPQPYVPPQPMFLGSPQHRGYGALMSPTQPYQDHYHRRYSDVNMMGAAAHHQGEPDSRGAGYFGPHGQNPEQYMHSSDGQRLSYSKPPEAFLDNSEQSRGQLQSPDRFTETSNISDFRPPSPDMYEVMSERERFIEGPQKFRDSPAEPDDLPSQGLYSPAASSAAPFTHGTQYRERSHDNPMRPHDIPMRSHDNPMRSHDPGPPSFQSRQNQRRLSTDRMDFRPRNGAEFRPRNGKDFEPRNRMDFGPRNGMGPMDSEMYSGQMEMENPRIELGWHSNRNSHQYEEGADWMNDGMEDIQRTPNAESDNFSGNHHLNKPAAVNEPPSSAKARVSWNNEIIEYARTPSECSSDHYDL